MRPHRGRFLNISLLCLVNFLWAAQYPAYKIASGQMRPNTLAFWTFLFGGLLLLPFLLRKRARHRRPRGPGRGGAWNFVLLAVAGLLPPSVFMAWGIAHSSAANAAILSLTIPVLMVLMAVILLGERVTLLRGMSLGLALGGTVLISRGDIAGGSFNLAVLAGNAVIFVAGAGSALYNTYSKRLLERFSELEVLVYGYAVAVVCTALLSAAFDDRPFFRVTGYSFAVWGAVLVLGGLSWGLAMVLWMWVLKRLAVTQVSVSIYLLPLFGVILSAVWLGERLTALHLVGGVVILTATFLTSEYESRRTAQFEGGEPL